MIEVIHVTKARGDDGQDFILRQTGEKSPHECHKKQDFEKRTFFEKKQ